MFMLSAVSVEAACIYHAQFDGALEYHNLSVRYQQSDIEMNVNGSGVPCEGAIRHVAPPQAQL